MTCTKGKIFGSGSLDLPQTYLRYITLSSLVKLSKAAQKFLTTWSVAEKLWYSVYFFKISKLRVGSPQANSSTSLPVRIERILSGITLLKIG